MTFGDWIASWPDAIDAFSTWVLDLPWWVPPVAIVSPLALTMSILIFGRDLVLLVRTITGRSTE